jgi:hypothetical protein
MHTMISNSKKMKRNAHFVSDNAIRRAVKHQFIVIIALRRHLRSHHTQDQSTSHQFNAYYDSYYHNISIKSIDQAHVSNNAQHMAHNGLNYYELLITYWWAKPSSTEVIHPFQADSGPDLSYRTPMRLKSIILERTIAIKPDFYRGLSKRSLKAYPFRRTAYRLIQIMARAGQHFQFFISILSIQKHQVIWDSSNLSGSASIFQTRLQDSTLKHGVVFTIEYLHRH